MATERLTAETLRSIGEDCEQYGNQTVYGCTAIDLVNEALTLMRERNEARNHWNNTRLACLRAERERDEARAELEELGGITTGPKAVPLQTARKIRDERDDARKALRELRKAQRAYMEDRGNEKLGKLVAAAAKKADEVLGDEDPCVCHQAAGDTRGCPKHEFYTGKVLGDE